MYICLRCNAEHDVKYGSGKYCSKKCAFTKNEYQLSILRMPRSEETKIKMRKPKSDTSRMGKRDMKGDKNPNSSAINGKLRFRNGDQYENICKSNRNNGLGWSEETKKLHSERMLGDSNWMRNKTHSSETIDKIKNTIKNKYKDGDFNSFTRAISRAEREICNFLIENNIKFVSQFIIPGKSHRYDIFLPAINLIIEYFGDYWHGNPKIYGHDKILGRGTNKYLASNKWESDMINNNFAISNGYDVEIIWESDFNNNKLEIFKKILKYAK